ncbi:MAG: hypothetical protein G01um10143_63 [Parcubacteria group bacterium Gr01-1014_3]|nr:MAG: hypothetical protein G01um10143_63 [Parcubacteria group bacterium Gr01-1014_3]
MALKDQLMEDMKAAMKAGNADVLGVIRMIISALRNKEIDLKAKKPDFTMTDEVVTEVLMSEAKKRKESALSFEAGGRADLAAKEKAELEVLQKYLPKQMGKEEIVPIVKDLIAKNAGKDFGLVMREVMKELKGKADGAIIGEVVKELMK